MSTTTHWATSSGGTGGAGVPGSSDTVTFDGSSGGGTVTPNFGGTGAFVSVAMGAFTGTLDFSANNNSLTLSAISAAFNCSGSGTRTLKMGNGTWTLTSTNGGGLTPWNMTNTSNLTLVANSSTIVFSGVNVSGGGGRAFVIGAASLTFNNLTFSGAGNYVLSLGNNCTFNTLTIGGQVNLTVSQGETVTVTSIATTSTSSTPASIVSNNPGSQYTISASSGTKSFSYIAIKDAVFTGGATFAATNSFDLGNNSGATITAPAAGGMHYTNDMGGNLG